MKRIFLTAAAAMSLMAAGLMPATAASTHSYEPTPYTPAGESWVSVAENVKTYHVSSTYDDPNSELDDYAIGYLPSGTSCLINGSEVLEGPALVDDDEDDCWEAATEGNGPTPIPIGFNLNFGGVTQSGLYLTTNGAITFSDSDFYDESLHYVALDDQDSGISVLGNDLGVYQGGVTDKSPTVIWTAQTTINGKKAFVISWENLSSHGDEQLQASVQLVFLNDGNGDFTAWFNYDKFEVDDQGADGPQVYSNLTKPLADGVYKAYSILGWDGATNSGTDNCYEVDLSDGGVYSATGEDTFSEPNYVKVIDPATKAISFHDDSACAEPFTFEEGSSHLLGHMDDDYMSYLPIGWFYNTPDGNGGAEVSATDLFYNVPIETLVDSGSDPIINRSINTDVPGRFVIGMKGGKTVGDNNDPATPSCVAPKKPTFLNYKDGNNVVGDTVSKALKRYAKAIAKSGCTNINVKVHMLKPFGAGGKGVWKKWENQTLVRARAVKAALKTELAKLGIEDTQIKAVGEGATDKLGYGNDNNRIKLVIND